MVFRLARTFPEPQNSQRGMPSPGEGAQTIGPYTPPPQRVPRTPVRPTQGQPSLFMRTNAGKQRGFAGPASPEQRRPPGSMPNSPPVYGRNIEVYTPPYSRGAAAVVQNYGKVLVNPIGAGIVAKYRPRASYGRPGVYYDKAIWWTSQTVPTSVRLTGLTRPEALAAMFSKTTVQAVVRTG